MKTISMFDFQTNVDRFIQRALRGERFLLTCEGCPSLLLTRQDETAADKADPFYDLHALAVDDPGPSNTEADEARHD
jgi:hypothetical protein